MIKRIALAIGSLAAAGVLALGLAAAGFGPEARVDAGQGPSADIAALAAPANDAPVTDEVTQVQTETVYIRPAATPRVVHVTRKVQAAKKQATTVVRTRRTLRHDDDEHEEREHEEREHEGEDDD